MYFLSSTPVYSCTIILEFLTLTGFDKPYILIIGKSDSFNDSFLNLKPLLSNVISNISPMYIKDFIWSSDSLKRSWKFPSKSSLSTINPTLFEPITNLATTLNIGITLSKIPLEVI